MTCAEDRGKVRRLRNSIIKRGEVLESTRKSAGRDGYIRGLEYALEIINREFGDVF